MSDISSPTVAIDLECGATHYSPPPMRAVRGVSFTYEQLEEFSRRLSLELIGQNLNRLGMLIAGMKPTGNIAATPLEGEEGDLGKAEFVVWLPAQLGNEYGTSEAILASLDRLIAETRAAEALDATITSTGVAS